MFGKLSTARAEAEFRALRAEIDKLARHVDKLSTELSTASTTTMLVRVNELEAALEALQKSNRREFGKLWKLYDHGHDESQTVTPPDSRAALRAAHAASIMPAGVRKP